VGEAYYERCKRVLAEVEEADLLVEQLYSEPQGTLKVSAPMSFGVSHVGPAVSDFLIEYGDLSVSLTLNDRFTDLIEEGFDVAIRISQSTDTSLIARRLGSIRCLMTAKPDYLELMGIPTKPQDLSNHQCLSYTYSSLRTGMADVRPQRCNVGKSVRAAESH
jgi:DNA-binding transcriptional LysR family regulator